MEHGVSISPVAFLIVQNDSVKLLEANHSSVLDKLVEYIPDAVDKIGGLIKKKMDQNKENFEDDDFYDDDYEDTYDDIDDKEENYSNDFDDFDDFDDEWISEDNDEDKESKVTKKKNEDTVKEVHKKEVNQIIDNGKGKAKKLEEKIKEIKKENNQ